MSDVNQVFICSAPRSGSTFLDMLLGGHPSITSLGEFSFLGKTLALDDQCACDQPISECESWRQVFDRVQAERGVNLAQDPYALWQWDTRGVRVIDPTQQTAAYLRASSMRNAWMNLRENLPAVMRGLLPMPASLRRGLANSLYLYDVIRECWGRQVVIDSSKNIFKALAVYRARPESTRIVLLTRDGRGVLFSRRKSGVPLKKSVNAWVKYYSRALQLTDRHVQPDHHIVVRYEDLAADPERAIGALLEFFGVPFDDRVIDLASGVRHVISGNSDSKRNRQLGIRLDEAWRRELQRTDLEYFAKIAGPLNARLGYEA